MFATDSNAFVVAVETAYTNRLALEGANLSSGKAKELETGFRAMTATVNVGFIASHALNADLSVFNEYAKAVQETRSILDFLRTGARPDRTANKITNTTFSVIRQILHIANKRKDKINEDGMLEFSHSEVQKGLSSLVAGHEGIKYDHAKNYQTKQSIGTVGAQSSLIMIALRMLGLSVKRGSGANLVHVVDVKNTAFDKVREIVK